MRRVLFLATVMVAGCATSATPIGSGALTARGHVESIPPFKATWRHDFDPPPVNTGPTFQVAGSLYDHQSGCLFVGTSAPGFHCYDPSRGLSLWKADLPEGIAGRPAVFGDNVIVGTDGGRIAAFSRTSGAPAWSYQVKGVVSRAPVLIDDLLLVVDGTNTVYALDASTGQWRWQYGREQPGEFAVFGESKPTAWGGLIFFGTSDGHITALDGVDGRERWTVALGVEGAQFVDVDADPVVVDGKLYAASISGGLFELDPNTGKTLWQTPIKGIVAMLAHDGDILMSLSTAEIIRFNLFKKRVAWKRGLPRENGSPGRIRTSGDLGAVAFSKGPLMLFNANTGSQTMKFDPGSGFLAPPELTDHGALYILSNRGVLYAFAK